MLRAWLAVALLCSGPALLQVMDFLAPRLSGAENPSSWNDSVQQGKALAAVGKHSEAARAFEQALYLARGIEIPEKESVELHDALASAYESLSHFREAEDQFRQALAIVDRAEGRESLNFGIILSSIALLPAQSERIKDAIPILRAAVTVHGDSASDHDLTVGRRSLAHLLIRQGNYKEAGNVLQDTLTEAAKRPAGGQALVAESLNDLGVVFFRQELYRESIDAALKAVCLLEATGSDSLLLETVLNNLAVSYVKFGRIEDAEITYRRAIRIAISTIGEEHPDYGELLANYTLVLRKLGRKQEAKAMQSKSERIIREYRLHNGIESTVNVETLRNTR